MTKMDNNNAEIILANISGRTSVRNYSDRAVPEEMIEKLLRAAMSAPSAMNGQPWEFIVVTERVVLDELADGLRYAKMLLGAPLAIVVCAHTSFVNKEGELKDNKFWTHDAAAATENILLASHALGLGAVWTAAADDRADVVRRVLKVPEGVSPFAVIPIGWPQGDATPKDKWKPERIHKNCW